MGTHLRVLGKSYPMNTNMTGFRRFQRSLRPCTLDESSLSIGRVSILTAGITSFVETYTQLFFALNVQTHFDLNSEDSFEKKVNLLNVNPLMLKRFA